MAANDSIRIGWIGRAHGLRGEVRLHLLRRYEEKAGALDRIVLSGAGAGDRTWAVEASRPHGGALLLRLAGISGRAEAEALRGADAAALREDLERVDLAGPYPEDLVGLDVVTREGRPVGKLEEVLDYPAGELYRIVAGGGEHLLPAVPAFVVETDIERRRLVIDPPPGLLDLNRP